MAEKIQTETVQNASVAPRLFPNAEMSGNQGNYIAPGKKPVPVFAIESLVEDDESFETAQALDIDKTSRPPMATFQSRLPEPSSDNISIANSEVILRRPPQLGRFLSREPSSPRNRPRLPHSHSTSDLGKYQQPYGRPTSKDTRSMVLPVMLPNRPRSPYINSIRSLHSMNSQSYGDGLHLMANQFSNSNSNLTRPATPQDRFVPYIPGDGGGFQNAGYPNGVMQNGGYINGSFPNGGYNNEGFQNGDYNNGGYMVSNGDEQYKQNRLTNITTSSSDQHLGTAPEAKKKLFTDILSTSGSTIYALFILTIGISLYVIDYLEIDDQGMEHLAEGFSLTLVCLALLYLLFLIIDISIYRHKKDKFEKLMENLTAEHIELKETNEGIAYDVTLHKALTLRKQLDHRYCFNMDRHSSNFYLKVGAAGFCFGHLIHSFLILVYRGILLNSTDIEDTGCGNTISFILEILYPLYSVILLFFIFKYSNVIINRHRDFHRFGFMHCLSASLCFWIFTIFRETAEYIQHSKNKYPEETGTEVHETRAFNSSSLALKTIGIIKPRRFTKMCENTELNVIYQSYSPYLYPFSVEYSILVVGILYIVWMNIGLCAATSPETEDHHGEDTRECKNYKPIEHESNFTIHADCHAANKGLFGGFIILVFAIVSVILFFITYFNSTGLADTGYMFINITGAVIMFVMIFATIFAYMQIIKLDVNEAAHNSLDNVLCLMCLPAFFVNGIFSIIPAIIYGQPLSAINIFFEIIQILIQTPFIIDGMARSSNTKELRKKKPGREFVTFLVICNVAMWIMQTFEVKSHGLNQYRQDFYSKELWSIVGHICLPLMMFYRFHASVCVGDIWKYAYIPSGH